MLIKEALEIIELQVAQNVYGKVRIEISLPAQTFHGLARYIKCCLKYKEDEKYLHIDEKTIKQFSVKVDGKKIHIIKKQE